MVSATAGVVCGALAADCAPVLLCRPAGPRGRRRPRRLERRADRRRRGGRGRGWSAWAPTATACAPPSAPASARQSYEVGVEFLERFTHFDAGLRDGSSRPAVSAEQAHVRPAGLRAAAACGPPGVETCEWVGRDTCAEPDLFFSNRRAFKLGEPDYGRLLSRDHAGSVTRLARLSARLLQGRPIAQYVCGAPMKLLAGNSNRTLAEAVAAAPRPSADQGAGQTLRRQRGLGHHRRERPRRGRLRDPVDQLSRPTTT